MIKVIQVKQKALANNVRDGKSIRPVVLVTLPNGQQDHGHELEILGPSKLVYRVEGTRHAVRLETEAVIRLTNWDKGETYEY